jgi:hypothetical protein
MQFLLLLASLFIHGAWAFAPLSRDGIAGSFTGYGDIVYQSVNFVPVCGTLGPSYTSGFNNGGDQSCVPAISEYSKTTDLVAMYDITGVRLPTTPGMGPAGCLCFSLAMLSGTAGDLCLWINGAAEPRMALWRG